MGSQLEPGRCGSSEADAMTSKDLIGESFLGGLHVFLSQDSPWCIINSLQCDTRSRKSQGGKWNKARDAQYGGEF